MTESSGNEEALSGGNVNAAVVRIGDTVRRAQNRNSPAVHRLLLHLEAKGFSAAPRFLGIDEKNREILSFLDGEASFPARLWMDDAPLVAAAKMLRDYHDALDDFDVGAVGDWAYAFPEPARHEVICHNDFAPYNMVFRNGLPTGIIDFDLCGPGPRLRDLAYLAYWLVPLSFAEGELSEHTRQQEAAGFARLTVVGATYGTKDLTGLLEMVFGVLAHMGNEEACARMIGADAAARLREGGHFDHWKKEAAAYAARLPELISLFG